LKTSRSYAAVVVAIVAMLSSCGPQDALIDVTPEDSSSTQTQDPRKNWSLGHSHFQFDAGTPNVTDTGTTPVPELDAGTAVVNGDAPPAIDAGTPPPPVDTGTPPPPPVDTGVPVAGDWLRTQGNRIVLPSGAHWHGRGANLQDTRSCSACAGSPSSVAEVNRRMDLLVDGWKANFIRLDLESYAGTGQVNWASVLSDPSYLADIKQIVAHAMTKPGLYVMLSLWIDPSINAQGWPTNGTSDTWRVLATAFKDEPRVLFGLVNEPQSNFDGAQDSQVWDAMNSTAQVIRDVEGTGPRHLISVQGTRSWSRSLDYYLTHPINAGGGGNIVYETHVYDGPSSYASEFEVPSQTLPVIIGEFGPAAGFMTEANCTEMMTRARAVEVPHLAWTFHQRCPPNLIQETAPGCGIGMTLTPTSWGTLVKNALAVPW
jgi:endoglucanase